MTNNSKDLICYSKEINEQTIKSKLMERIAEAEKEIDDLYFVETEKKIRDMKVDMYGKSNKHAKEISVFVQSSFASLENEFHRNKDVWVDYLFRSIIE